MVVLGPRLSYAVLVALVLTVGTACAPASGTSTGATSPSAGPVASRELFFGISVPDNDPSLLAGAVAAAGRPPTVDAIFTRMDSTSLTATRLAAIAAAGMTPMVTLEPWRNGETIDAAGPASVPLTSIVAGVWDARITALAQTFLAFGRPMMFRFAHEMNGWWYPWAVGNNGNTAAVYVAAWRHVTALVKRVAGPQVSAVWSPNAITGSPRESPVTATFPGDDLVDAVGMTAYGHGASPSDTLDPTYAALTAVSRRPVLLTETGADGPDKGAWITAFGPWLRAHDRVQGFVWFDTTPASGASGDYRFDDTPAHAALFAAMLHTAQVAS